MIAGALTQSVDVVGIYDANFRQAFVDARPLKANVSEPSKVMEHPIENGSVIVDHHVIEPVEIELTLMVTAVTYRDVYARIKAAFLKADLMTVQTRTSSYSNMLITKMPHDEAGDIADGYVMALTLREVILVSAQFQALPPRAVAKGPRNARNVSTVKRGEQNAKPEQGNRSSVLYRAVFGK